MTNDQIIQYSRGKNQVKQYLEHLTMETTYDCLNQDCSNTITDFTNGKSKIFYVGTTDTTIREHYEQSSFNQDDFNTMDYIELFKTDDTFVIESLKRFLIKVLGQQYGRQNIQSIPKNCTHPNQELKLYVLSRN